QATCFHRLFAHRRPRPLSPSLPLFARAYTARVMKGLRTAAACAAALALVAAAARAGVGVEAPLGWDLSLHTGYTTVLCLLVHPGGSRISLAVDATTARDAAALAAESRLGLAAQGIEVTGSSPGPHAGVFLDARLPRRGQVLRQLYLVRAVDGGPGARQDPGAARPRTARPPRRQARPPRRRPVSGRDPAGRRAR